MSDEPLKTCPKCGKELRRLINGGTGIIFKGGGFYVTDKGGKSVRSAGKSSGNSEEAPKAAACSGCANAESAACPKAANS
jgi:predicted nucleic acid-binding Zn ribbon protein